LIGVHSALLLSLPTPAVQCIRRRGVGRSVMSVCLFVRPRSNRKKASEAALYGYSISRIKGLIDKGFRDVLARPESRQRIPGSKQSWLRINAIAEPKKKKHCGRCTTAYIVCLSGLLQCRLIQAVSIGIASYGALGHVPPRLTTVYIF